MKYGLPDNEAAELDALAELVKQDLAKRNKDAFTFDDPTGMVSCRVVRLIGVRQPVVQVAILTTKLDGYNTFLDYSILPNGIQGITVPGCGQVYFSNDFSKSEVTHPGQKHIIPEWAKFSLLISNQV